LAPDRPGLVVPAPTNAHTHIADLLARGHVEASTVEEVFAPPDGIKHRLLAAASDQELVASMRQALDEASAHGMARVLDFREGGPAGARLARQASAEASAEMVVLGRPTEPGRWAAEAGALKDLVDGLGVSGIEDQPFEVTQAQAAWCRDHGKILALHVSEARQEDLEAVLSLEPDLLVHATQVTGEDIQALAQARVPVVLCPRSNALFDNTPPVLELLEAGVPLGLGSDNAMFQTVEVWQEAAFLLDRFPSLEPVHVLRMACAFSLPGQAPPALAPGERVCVVDTGKGLRTGLTHAWVEVPWQLAR
ncbi:MAG: amidohydrolase family protein, partial [Candidatus Thermoplasmatota archaeon]|nr:amidohydrolase family protein [Candidatus Thermoplasmatota archaeon]